MALDPRLATSVAPAWTGENAKAEWYGQFVCAAYIMGEDDPLNPPAAPKLPDGYGIIADIYMTDFVFAKDPLPTHYGLLAANAAGHHVLAIRGTVGWKEWWADLTSLDLVPCVFKSSATTFGKVGFGFLALYNTLTPIRRGLTSASDRAAMLQAPRPTSFATALHAIIKDHAAEQGTLRAATVDIVGHSLGSSLTTLYAVDGHAGPDNFPANRLCTFASPMVGDDGFLAAFETGFLARNPDRSWRFYISTDVVPKVPPAILGFVPVDGGIELTLGWDTSWWSPACAHSLSSYLHVLDPNWPLPSACTGSTATDRCTPPAKASPKVFV